MILEERRAQSRPNTQARTWRGAGTRVAAVKSMLPGTYIVNSGRDRHDRLIVRCTHGVIDGYYVHQHGALAQKLDQFSIQVPLTTRMCARHSHVSTHACKLTRSPPRAGRTQGRVHLIGRQTLYG